MHFFAEKLFSLMKTSVFRFFIKSFILMVFIFIGFSFFQKFFSKKMHIIAKKLFSLMKTSDIFVENLVILMSMAQSGLVWR